MLNNGIQTVVEEDKCWVLNLFKIHPFHHSTLSERVGSKKGRMGNALACSDDEGRGKLRKATGSCKRTLIRRCPNGET